MIWLVIKLLIELRKFQKIRNKGAGKWNTSDKLYTPEEGQEIFDEVILK